MWIRSNGGVNDERIMLFSGRLVRFGRIVENGERRRRCGYNVFGLRLGLVKGVIHLRFVFIAFLNCLGGILLDAKEESVADFGFVFGA